MKSHQIFGIGFICLGLFVAALTIGLGFLPSNPFEPQKTPIVVSSNNNSTSLAVTTQLPISPDKRAIVIDKNVTDASSITIDPIFDKNIGDLIIISGTTTLPPRTSIYLKEIDRNTGQATMKANKVVCPDSNGINRWTFVFDSTSMMKPGSYQYFVSTPKGNVASSVQFTLKGKFLGPEKTQYFQKDSKLATLRGTGNPYININPIGDRKKGDVFRVSGTTNLAEGTLLSCTLWPEYFEDVSKRPSVSSNDPCNGQWYAISASTAVINGGGDINRWSFAADTTIAEKTKMIVHVSTTDEDFTKKEIYGNITFDLN